MVYLIDRRPNDRGKSAVNRERFLRRYKTHIQDCLLYTSDAADE